MLLHELVFALMIKHAPPGRTAFSVAPATDCVATAETCEGAKRSSFYGTWVRKETAEQGEARYRVLAETLVESAREALCVDEFGTAIERCVPLKGVYAGKKRRWTVMTLSVAGAAVALVESGYREDVQVGRGASKKPSDDGGRGRGPSMEGCPIQAHPTVAWMFAPVPDDLRSRAQAGDEAAREEVVQSLLGSDREALKRCWTTGLRMLVHARAYCAWAAPQTEWSWATIALFGSGTSCVSANNGKTSVRVRMFAMMLDEARHVPRTPSSGEVTISKL